MGTAIMNKTRTACICVRQQLLDYSSLDVVARQTGSCAVRLEL